MEKLTINTETNHYPVYIDKGLRKRVFELISEAPSAILVVTDDQVAPHFLHDVVDSLKTVVPVFSYVVPSGEQSKSFQTYKTLIDKCVELQLDRKALIVALGGGVIGDLAGFVASTYLRGISYIQMPTTLLAHDSSVGGKVGINHESGKNLIGSFYHPKAVIYDTETLATLPQREWRSGFVEMMKHSLIDSKAFYEALHQSFPDDKALNIQNIEPWLARAISVKAKVVAEDEKESGVRAILNFGHTFGHAIEKESNGQFNHGESVAIGMLFAMKLSEQVIGSTLPIQELQAWYTRLGLPAAIPDSMDRQKVYKRMFVDKKRRDNDLVFILLTAVGETTIQKVPESIVQKLLNEF